MQQTQQLLNGNSQQNHEDSVTKGVGCNNNAVFRVTAKNSELSFVEQRQVDDLEFNEEEQDVEPSI